MGKRFYVLWGQSNMVGQGMVGNLPDGLDAAMSDVQVWDGSSFEALQADVNTGSVGAAPPWDFGPEITFGRTLADDFGETIYLLKVAVAGTRIEPHGSNDDWHPTSSGDLYDDMIGHIGDYLAADPDLILKAIVGVEGRATASTGTARSSKRTSALVYAPISPCLSCPSSCR